MRCLSCHTLSFFPFCRICKEQLIKPTITKRVVDNLEIYSFFNYQDIEDLLLTKHTPQGFKVYNALANMVFKPFIEKFIEEYKESLYILGIDETVMYGYSHVAVLTHALEHKNVRVLYGKLRAKNSIKYAGKSLLYRLEHPRGFKYRGLKGIDVILVDDIVTTGTTLKEAKSILEKEDVNVIFALTLAGVKV